MPRKYPFYPSWNGRKASPITEWFSLACRRRWGFTQLGIYANRDMRSSENLSVHATGWAFDLGYTDRKTAVEAFNWLVTNSKTLRIAAVHDYAFKAQGSNKAWGRGYRCNRGEGMRGVKEYTALDNAGTPGMKVLHIELENTWTSVAEFQQAWRSIPKP